MKRDDINKDGSKYIGWKKTLTTEHPKASRCNNLCQAKQPIDSTYITTSVLHTYFSGIICIIELLPLNKTIELSRHNKALQQCVGQGANGQNLDTDMGTAQEHNPLNSEIILSPVRNSTRDSSALFFDFSFSQDMPSWCTEEGLLLPNRASLSGATSFFRHSFCTFLHWKHICLPLHLTFFFSMARIVL